MKEALHLAHFELGRIFSGPRLILWIALILFMSFSSGENTLQIALSSGASNGDLSILDPFYLGLNSPDIASTLLPATCLLLCADMFSKDTTTGYMRLVMSKVNKAESYWFGKILASASAIFITLSFFFAGSLFFGALIGMGLPSIYPAAWLASPGIDFTTLGPFCPIPSSWNYPLFTILLIPGFTLIESAVVFPFESILGRCRSPHAPIVISILLIVLANMLSYLCNNLGLMFNIPWMLSSVGWISDRFSLANYRLDASFFQTTAGIKAAGADISPTSPQSLAFPINSWASILFICLALLLIAFHFAWKIKRTEGIVVSDPYEKGTFNGQLVN